MAQCEEWIADVQQYSSDKRVGRTMSHHAAALKVSGPASVSPLGDSKRRQSHGHQMVKCGRESKTHKIF